MPLDDPRYLGLLLAVFVVFQVLPGGAPRRAWLLLASVGFYISLSGVYAACLGFVTLVAFAAAHAMRRLDRRGTVFVLGIVAIILPLLTFKYLGFLLQVSGDILSLGGAAWPTPVLKLLLPVGISFFTFAALGYLIDVYLEVAEPETDPVRFGLFLAFFPIITAGPIERSGTLTPQLELQSGTGFEQLLVGCRTILFGLVLKVVIANNIGVSLGATANTPQAYSALEHAAAAILFVFYIYADFAGYTLIALGSAALFGIRIRPNFAQPLLSRSIPEFWRNWHMSLSSWVRDYVFTPLRVRWRQGRQLGMIAALVLSFVIIGVWHGPGWGFALFGLIHGTLAALSTLTLARRDRFWTSLRMPPLVVSVQRVLATFLLVALAFVPYRTHSIADAAHIAGSLFSFDLLRQIQQAIGDLAQSGAAPALRDGLASSTAWLLAACVIAVELAARLRFPIHRVPQVIRFVGYNLLATAVIYQWVATRVPQPFLYYNF